MVSKIIEKFYLLMKNDKNQRYKSREHCYLFFRNHENIDSEKSKDLACLNLAFYLASWGMYRGSSFLLQKDYKIHIFAVNTLLDSRYNSLWNCNVDVKLNDDFINLVMKAKKDISKSYIDNIVLVNNKEANINVTDTLITKIMLGTFGCVPAYDMYFLRGLKYHGFKSMRFNEYSLRELIDFYKYYKKEFEKIKRITESDGLIYPPMKLVDMYFWEVGVLLNDNSEVSKKEFLTIKKISSEWKLKKSVSTEKTIGYDGINPKKSNLISLSRWNHNIRVKDVTADAIKDVTKNDKSVIFTPKEIIDNVIKKYPDVNKNTVRCHVTSNCVNHSSRRHYPGGQDLCYLVDKGRYRLYDSKNDGKFNHKGEKISD